MKAEELYEFVREVFGSDGLYVARESALSESKLDPPSKDYLCMVGLPKIPLFNIDFSVLETLPTIRAVATELNFQIPSQDAPILHMRCIGRQYNVVFAVDCFNGGEVLYVELGGSLNVMFVNSKPEFFGAFLAAYHQNWKSAGEKIQPADAELTSRLREIDALAIDHPENWWGIVLEEIEFGLS